jgi:predicted MFS family arabinose efflux permease
MGFAVCGIGVGTFVFPPLSQVLLDAFGWRGALLIQAGVLLSLVVCGLVFRPLHSPTSHPSEESGNALRRHLDLLQNSAYLCYVTATSLAVIGFCGNLVFLPDLAQQLGVGSQEASFLVSISGISSTVLRIILGPVVDSQCLLRVHECIIII